ncbi:MAG TPA: hypothetical protein VHA79_00985 [Mycobacteriales bacterium]|nr:hypothetical protein [Mycobacteriales bacterium]
MTFEEPEYRPASRSEMALVVTGVLVFIASFLPWYGVTFEGGLAEAGVTGTYNAWHGLTAAGLLLVLLSLVVTASGPMLGEDAPSRPLSIAAAALAAVGAVLVVVRSFDLPDLGIPGATSSLKWGGWILIVLVVLHAAICVYRAVRSQEPVL